MGVEEASAGDQDRETDSDPPQGDAGGSLGHVRG